MMCFKKEEERKKRKNKETYNPEKAGKTEDCNSEWCSEGRIVLPEKQQNQYAT